MRRELLDWFAGRGWKPFDFQKEAWAAYERGESGLVHAPTGTGKSYSVWLGPLGEAMDAGREEKTPMPLTVLWLTPLRALANDIAESLRLPIADLKLPWTVEVRTGDTSSAIRNRQKQRLPSALITTPESLSLLLSYPDAIEKFRSLRCVVVDEWHELLGTKRGVQTELGLARLRKWARERNEPLRVWGLSATLGNLEQARDVLLAGDRGELIQARLSKSTEIETLLPHDIEHFPWAGHLGVKLLPQVVAAIETHESTLVFTNVRSGCEIWQQALLEARPDWADCMAIHHGSLDREIREEVEERLRLGLLKCVVCTASLDLGVDFSPVDQVIQVGSPKGIARLLQRAGRSGHQPGGVSRILGVPTHAFELVEFSAARQAAAAGRIESKPLIEKPLDVLAQHLVTLALGGGFEPGEAFNE
ncbi:MAG: DEAD/DEAH box helicase, partial [Verrucomicrobiae bacterium]|nr:DEAD/DEAH box helicase [Verrucomicrobiae bacterium]